jgi:hypothetical protein
MFYILQTWELVFARKMKRLKKIWWVIPAVLMWWGCERDYLFRGGDEGITFSSDTVMFDTIFTSIGSATRNFRIYNPYGSDMTIDAIRLAGGDDSKFRINVNGVPSHEVYEVPMRAGDSLYVFVEVTINPGESSDPSFVVTDSIVFSTKERNQSVKLVAYGQDVVLMRNQTIESMTFTAEKPYLIYDWLKVDTAAVLTIEEGAHLYFYQGAGLAVYSEASLKVKGTKENPVLFAGSRLEDWYLDKPGQWEGIILAPGSKNHDISYASIRNATIGLNVDSVGLDGDAPLLLSNVKIEHISKQGLVAQASSIIAHNSLFADAGSASVALTYGGHYEFYHCTIANFFNWGKYRSIPALLLSNYYFNKDNKPEIRDMEEALFSNCIIWGSNTNELGLDFEPKVKERNDKEEKNEFLLNYRFENSLLRTSLSEEQLSDKKYFNNVIVNHNPSFVDYQKYNYQLDTLSIAIDAGSMEAARKYPLDYLGNSRINANTLPDLGYIERVELN